MSTYASVQNSPLTVRSISGRSLAPTTFTRTDDGIGEAVALLAALSASSNDCFLCNFYSRVLRVTLKYLEVHLL